MADKMESDEETCENYENLLICIDKFIQSIRDKPGSCKKLAKSFPQCYKESPELLQNISEQMWGSFEASQKQHIMSLVEKHGLKESLCRLNRLHAEDGKSWRPSGKPKEDISAYVLGVLDEEVTKLTEMAQQARSETEVLRDEVMRKEKKVKSLMREIEESVEDWEEMARECEKKEKTREEVHKLYLDMDL